MSAASKQASAIDIRYDPVEDRMCLTARDDARVVERMLLTRRLARALIAALVEMLNRSNPEMSRVTAEHREAVMLFEHVDALGRDGVSRGKPGAGTAGKVSGGVDEGGSVAPVSAGVLLRRIDLTFAAPFVHLLMFEAETPCAILPLGRHHAHQLLGLLVEQSRSADWRFSEFDWIDRRANIVRNEAARPC